jgi:DNA polymerase (family 10)
MDAPKKPTLPSNGELARIFHEIGDMLEVKGELVFKTVAYHRAADAIAQSGRDGARLPGGDPPRIPAWATRSRKKIEELADGPAAWRSTTAAARCRRASWRCCEIPGVGPKTVKQLHDELGRSRRSTTCGGGRVGSLRD